MNANEKKLTNEISDGIIQFIRDENLRPGNKLPNETEMAKRMGVGRSTLREAVRRLESRNILEIRQGSGTYVSKKNGIPEDPLGLMMVYGSGKEPEQALDLIDVRLLLEPEIAALAAIHITEEQKVILIRQTEAVSASIARNDEEYDYKKHMDFEVSYHAYIAECSGNRVLQNLSPIITTSIQMAITSWDQNLRIHAAPQHEAITRAICRHDMLGARTAMVAHLISSREFYVNAIAERNNLLAQE